MIGINKGIGRIYTGFIYIYIYIYICINKYTNNNLSVLNRLCKF